MKPGEEAAGGAYETLRLDRQLCFPLYAASRAVIRLYHPALSALDLTYTQYITMMALWEKTPQKVTDLCRRLWLDTGTLTPLLKTLEKKGLVCRSRSEEDERSVSVALTAAGEALREQAQAVPAQVGACIPLEPQRAQQLYELLYELLEAQKK